MYHHIAPWFCYDALKHRLLRYERKCGDWKCNWNSEHGKRLSLELCRCNPSSKQKNRVIEVLVPRRRIRKSDETVPTREQAGYEFARQTETTAFFACILSEYNIAPAIRI